VDGIEIIEDASSSTIQEQNMENHYNQVQWIALMAGVYVKQDFALLMVTIAHMPRRYRRGPRHCVVNLLLVLVPSLGATKN
jgi:hypothetical protein